MEAARARDIHRQRQGGGIRRLLPAERRGHGHLRRRTVAGAKPQPGKDVQLQDSRPDGADPGNFCAARPHARRQVADRTGAAATFAAAADAVLGPLVAAGGRHRHARRRRRIAAGIRPPQSAGAHRPDFPRTRTRAPPARDAARGRQRSQWPLASIVGYTNAGKSTLLNALTGADVLVKDKLFATLDPTTRRLRLPTNQNVLLTDTVGFIRKLPHGLVEAFKATLEEVVQADLLLHVVDISHPQAEEQIAAVNAVLEEIGAEEKPTIMVFNKMDRPGVMAMTRA